MLKVGLTGGIGSGKSTVSALLAAHGAVVVDYDLLARQAVEVGSPGLAQIAERFGEGVIAPDGTLNRPALGAIVFADEQSLRDLEAITHPAISKLSAALEESAGPDSIMVHDNALLVDTGMYKTCDVVVVVDVPEEVQIARLVTDRGMSEAEARARIGAQVSRDERTGVADHVIDNTGSRDELAHIVGGVWSELVSRAEQA